VMKINTSAPLSSPGTPKSVSKRPVTLSFLHVKKGEDFCLSKCRERDLRQAIDCLRILTTLTWEDVHAHDGLNYTRYEDHALRKVKRPPSLDRSMTISGIRAGDMFRIFGAYHEHVYYVLWFDPHHEIVPPKKH
jgi:hypothetical protein